MHRQLRNLVKANHSDDTLSPSKQPDADVTQACGEIPAPCLKVKRLDYSSDWTGGMTYKTMKPKLVPKDTNTPNFGGFRSHSYFNNSMPDSLWKDCAFLIIRSIWSDYGPWPIHIVIISEYVRKACKDVVQSWPGISWNTPLVQLPLELFFTYLDQFTEYRNSLALQKSLSVYDSHVLSSVELLVSTLNADYGSTISKIARLLAHGEITSDLIYVILIPRTLFTLRHHDNRLRRTVELMTVRRGDGTQAEDPSTYFLHCESIDQVNHTARMGRIQETWLLPKFEGTRNIQDLGIFPLKYLSHENAYRKIATDTGIKWAALHAGVHHKQYNGVAVLVRPGLSNVRHNVKGRIMVDGATYRCLNPDHKFPKPAQEPGVVLESLTGRELLLTSTVVHGFSLEDKLWLQFNICDVTDIVWNKDAFVNLVLPPGRKQLLRSIIEAHDAETGSGDFVKGKGDGLIINLSGPPGVGKTFSAEAISEQVKKPLYIVRDVDLGTRAVDIDVALERIFRVASSWKAIILIDEADVFLERRSHHCDMERNAIVAVFLRHVEYYRGILLLTTNRLEAYDEAFFSRIHIAIDFPELSQVSRGQVLKEFLKKGGAQHSITDEQIGVMAQRELNGREIKNAVKTAFSLARARKEMISCSHLEEMMDLMREFNYGQEK